AADADGDAGHYSVCHARRFEHREGSLGGQQRSSFGCKRGGAMSKSVAYTSSPLLASKTPVWRSKFIVAAIAFGFLALAGRAAWVQVFGNDFFQKQGEVRF